MSIFLQFALVEKLFPGLFLKNQNCAYLWINILKFCTFCFNYLLRPTLKNCSFPITFIIKKKVTLTASKPVFFTLLKLNITFYFKCYSHHNCSVNLNWNNTQLYSSAKPLHNVPSSVFWFVNFCFLPFCAELAFRNGRKTGCVMYTSK